MLSLVADSYVTYRPVRMLFFRWIVIWLCVDARTYDFSYDCCWCVFVCMCVWVWDVSQKIRCYRIISDFSRQSSERIHFDVYIRCSPQHDRYCSCHRIPHSECRRRCKCQSDMWNATIVQLRIFSKWTRHIHSGCFRMNWQICHLCWLLVFAHRHQPPATFNPPQTKMTHQKRARPFTWPHRNDAWPFGTAPIKQPTSLSRTAVCRHWPFNLSVFRLKLW